MGLGPPVCDRCKVVMNGGLPLPGPYYDCGICGIDSDHEDCKSLFRYSRNEIEVILKDSPEMLKVTRNIWKSGDKQRLESLARAEELGKK